MNKYEIDTSNKNSDIDFYHNFNDYPTFHNHDYYEFFMVVDGCYRHIINGKTFIMYKNQAFLIRENDYHAIFENSKDRDSSHINIAFKKDFFVRFCNSLSPSLLSMINNHEEFPISLSDSQKKKIVDYTSLLKDNFSTNIDKGLVTNLLMSYILEKAISQNDLISDVRPKWLTDLLLQINSPMNVNWQVDDVLAKENYSRTHFSRLFKEYVGCTLVEYLTRAKMSAAHDFLLHSNMSILDISQALGYSSLCRFNHVFKDFFKVNPTQYKRINKNK